MKKVLAVLLSLVMVFAFCLPTFAAGELDQISQTIQSILNSIIGGGDSSDPTLPEISYDVKNAEQADNVISILQTSGVSKADIQTLLDEKLASGEVTQESYDLLAAALEKAPETTTDASGSITLPSIEIPEEDVAEAAQAVISALKQAGVTNEQMQGVVDQLFESGVLPENVYNEITNQINSSEETTAASNSGGIGGFLSGIVDTVMGLFGLGGDDNTGDSNNANSSNSSDFGGKDATGDTALISVAAVAAVAGVALVLTKKKQK